MKISGYLKSVEMGISYCMMRGYLDTCRKHGIMVFKAIKTAMDGQRTDDLFA
jgi:hypothetical protein